MTKRNETAADFRAEARSLALSAERDADPTRSRGYSQAAGRCSRVAKLLDDGVKLDTATAIVNFGQLGPEDTEDRHEALEALRTQAKWDIAATEGEALGDCEHGLAAWLCSGPNHY